MTAHGRSPTRDDLDDPAIAVDVGEHGVLGIAGERTEQAVRQCLPLEHPDAAEDRQVLMKADAKLVTGCAQYELFQAHPRRFSSGPMRCFDGRRSEPFIGVESVSL